MPIDKTLPHRGLKSIHKMGLDLPEILLPEFFAEDKNFCVQGHKKICCIEASTFHVNVLLLAGQKKPHRRKSVQPRASDQYEVDAAEAHFSSSQQMQGSRPCGSFLG